MADETKTEEGRPFLSRWSRLKARDRRPEPEPEPAAVEEPAAEDEAPLPEAVQEAEEANRKAAEAVDLESLDYGSDFRLFLKPGVPELLRKQALRRLWRSNPVLANLDGLNDYDEDFTLTPGVSTVVQSLWQAGKGFLEDRPEEEPESAALPPDRSVSLRPPEAEEVAEAEAEPVPDAPVPDEPAAEAAVEEERPRVGLRARLDLEAFKVEREG